MGNLARSIISSKLIGMGDSHLDMFTFFCAATCRVPGATAYGLISDISNTNAKQAFTKFLDAFPNYLPLLCIGEVDCNSLLWMSEITDSPEETIHHSINNLFKFLSTTNRNFILPSVILPTIETYKELKIRQHVSADKRERTKIVEKFNELLKRKSKEHDHYFIDITTPITNVDGLIDESYIISPYDVHLKPFKMYDIIRPELDRIGKLL